MVFAAPPLPPLIPSPNPRVDSSSSPAGPSDIDAISQPSAQSDFPAGAKAAVDSLVSTIAGGEPVLSVVFLHTNLQRNVAGKLPGLIGGLLLGGAGGEMLFGGTLLSKASISGTLVVALLTPTRLLARYCENVPFSSGGGEINHEHLDFLAAQCKSNALPRADYPLAETQFYYTSDGVLHIAYGSTTDGYRKAELFFNDRLYPTPSLQQVFNQIDKLGTRPAPFAFITSLLSGQSPLSAGQVDAAAKDEAYIASLTNALLAHPQSRTLMEKLPLLPDPLRTTLEQTLQAMADAYPGTLRKLTAWGVVVLIPVIIMASRHYLNDTALVFCLLGIITGGVFSGFYMILLQKYRKARNALAAFGTPSSATRSGPKTS